MDKALPCALGNVGPGEMERHAAERSLEEPVRCKTCGMQTKVVLIDNSHGSMVVSNVSFVADPDGFAYIG